VRREDIAVDQPARAQQCFELGARTVTTVTAV